MEEAARARKQVSPLILELALEALQWRRHAGNSGPSGQQMRHADA
jgi:hypothetical protein